MENKGCVYFFRHIGLTPVKIGFSDNESPIGRFNQFKTYAPYGSEILGFIICCNANKLESELHRKFSSKRLSGEWFDITDNQVESEIQYRSNIEDINNRNEFQIAWANELAKKKVFLNDILGREGDTDKKINSLIAENPNMYKAEIAKKIGISRQTLYKYLRK